MARIIAILAATVALAVGAGLGATATAAVPPPPQIEEGGGGSSTPSIYVIRYFDGSRWWNCEYIDFGNGLVIQSRCW